MPAPQPKSLRETGATPGHEFPNEPHAQRVLVFGQRAERRAAARWLRKQQRKKQATACTT